jgi:hypothetical protein
MSQVAYYEILQGRLDNARARITRLVEKNSPNFMINAEKQRVDDLMKEMAMLDANG